MTNKKCSCPIGECLEIFRALSDETRQEIVTLLATQKEINATDIAEHFNLSRPTISHHLNLMKRMKLLNARKQGKEIFYSFNKPYVIGLLESFIKNLKNCC
jgi:DNA-binding transcriptional ArsR family regulator